jgi:acyl carrier protein
MGLDIVEMVMEVEDAFDVRIPDNLASQIVTVGDLYDFIISARGETADPRQTCLSAATFFMIRRALVSELGVERRALRPATLVDQALPAPGRRRIWRSLQSRIDLKLPALCRPQWLVVLSTAGVVVAASLPGLLVYREWGANAAVAVALASLVPLGLASAVATRPFTTRPHANFATFRGLSHVVLAHNYTKISGMFAAWNPTDVWNALQIIIAEQLGVPRESVTRDASFVKDLGAG